MFQAIYDWIFHRALRLSAATVKVLAAKTGQDPKKITAVNDTVAGIAANEAVQQVQAAAQKAVPVLSAVDGGGS